MEYVSLTKGNEEHTHITPLPSCNTYVYTARILDFGKQQLFGDRNLCFEQLMSHSLNSVRVQRNV